MGGFFFLGECCRCSLASRRDSLEMTDGGISLPLRHFYSRERVHRELSQNGRSCNARASRAYFGKGNKRAVLGFSRRACKFPDNRTIMPLG